MTLFEFKLDVMNVQELKDTISNLKDNLESTSNANERKTIRKMIKMTESKLKQHTGA